MPYQLLSNQDELRPTESFISTHIIAELLKAPDAPVINAAKTLNEVRRSIGLSTEDTAWSALYQTALGKTDLTQIELMYLLEGARGIHLGGVVLSFFHGAKGTEFERVFVLEEDTPLGRSELLESHARSLYVGMTRAKEALHVLLGRRAHPALRQAAATSLEVLPRCNLPKHICYLWQPEMRDLYLSAGELLSESGRAAVRAYARNWGALSLASSGKRACWQGRAVTAFSAQGQKKMAGKLRGRQAHVQGRSIVRIERDDYWYDCANYRGPEDHHYLVLPSIEFTEQL